MAAVGEISSAEWEELQAHLKQCASCHGAFAQIGEIHSNWLPERPGFEIERSPAAESRLRRLILNRAVTEGASFSVGVQSLLPHKAGTESKSQLRGPRAFFGGVLAVRLSLATGVLIILVLAGVAGVGWRQRTLVRSAMSATALETEHAPREAQTLPTNSNPPQATPAQAQQAAQRQLELALKKSQAERERLERRVEEADSKAGNLQQVNAQAALEVAELRQQLASARGNEARAEQEMVKLKSTQADKDAQLILVREENRELREKVTEESSSLAREGELMAAGREIRDLIAARNLHIIDVYDTNGDGRTQKSFGRVFYTEGKSLVFYAYDLPARRPDPKYAFYAWGKRDASEQGIRKLGIFFNDDQMQKRWVLQITNPHLLSEIDSVFITLEPTDKLGIHPSGKKLLSAFLGSPANHP